MTTTEGTTNRPRRFADSPRAPLAAIRKLRDQMETNTEPSIKELGDLGYDILGLLEQLAETVRDLRYVAVSREEDEGPVDQEPDAEVKRDPASGRKLGRTSR